MNRQISTTSILLLGCCHIAFAGSVTLFTGGGFNIVDLKNNSEIGLNNTITNGYSTKQHTTINGTWMLGAGYTFYPSHNVTVSALITAAYDNLGKVKGTKAPFINGGDFDTLNYRYDVRSYEFFIGPKISYTAYTLQPYVEAGAGISLNRLSNYYEAPTDSNSGASPVKNGFQDNTETDFAYMLGIGVQTMLYHGQHFQLLAGLGYQYRDLGNAKLQPMPTQTINNTIKIKHLYTQDILFTLTARF